MKNSSPTWPSAELFSWTHKQPGAEKHEELGFNPGSVQPGSYCPTYPSGPGLAHGATPSHSSAMRNSIAIQAKKHLPASATLIHLCYSSISQNISCPWGMFLATGLLGYSLINSWNTLCRDASSPAFDPGDNGRNTLSLLLTKEPVILPPLVPTPAHNSWSLAMIYFYTVIASITAIPASSFVEGAGSG